MLLQWVANTFSDIQSLSFELLLSWHFRKSWKWGGACRFFPCGEAWREGNLLHLLLCGFCSVFEMFDSFYGQIHILVSNNALSLLHVTLNRTIPIQREQSSVLHSWKFSIPFNLCNLLLMTSDRDPFPPLSTKIYALPLYSTWQNTSKCLSRSSRFPYSIFLIQMVGSDRTVLSYFAAV